MDPVVAGLYLAAAIAKKLEDKVLNTAWDVLSGNLRATLGREATPADATPERIVELAGSDVSVRVALENVGASSQVLRRASLVQQVFAGAKVLWIDDEPDVIALETATLRALGADVRMVSSGAAATALLRSSSVDLILSDISRPESSMAGISDLALLRLVAPQVPVVFYIMRMAPRGVPDGAFGITARPDDLLHLCMDALERRRL